MKKLCLLPIVVFALAVSCEKPLSEADRNAQIEREVQQRLAAERQTQERERLAQQQAELDTRERALAEKEAVAAQAPVSTPRATPRQTEARSVSSSADRPPRSYDTFYRKLEPYGAWREAGEYGYVWQPRAAQSPHWRPYTDGRWAYTDAGWTWVSREPFGWATYHYGRWTRLRGVGWVWVPGDEWAPAWVSWRTSDRHVGWAPLPPAARFERRTGIKKWADSYYDIGADEYVFIPNEDIGAENIGDAVIPVERNITIVNETTNVTNITYINTTIVNEGPNYEQLRGRSHRPVERLQLQREYDIDETRTPQSSVRGNVLSIMTPLFTARAVQRPRNAGAPIPQATVERNWAPGANSAEGQRARAKMKAETAPPPDAPSRTFEKPAVLEGAPAPEATATPGVPTPVAAPTPVATPVDTPRPAPTPRPTETPRRGPRPTITPEASAAPSPLATVTPPVDTPRPRPIITPRIIPTPRAVSTPILAPPHGVTDPPEREEKPTPESDKARQTRGDARAEQLRRTNEARNARLREIKARPTAPPTAIPQPATAPAETESTRAPGETVPNLQGRRRALALPPRPLATPSSTPQDAAPAPVEKVAPAVEKAAGDENGRENPKATPSGADEP